MFALLQVHSASNSAAQIVALRVDGSNICCENDKGEIDFTSTSSRGSIDNLYHIVLFTLNPNGAIRFD